MTVIDIPIQIPPGFSQQQLASDALTLIEQRNDDQRNFNSKLTFGIVIMCTVSGLEIKIFFKGA